MQQFLRSILYSFKCISLANWWKKLIFALDIRLKQGTYLDQGRTMRRGVIVSRRWARGWPRAPGRDGTASGGENPGLVAEQHLPDLFRTSADPLSPRISAGRRTLWRVPVRSPIDTPIPPLSATLSRPRVVVPTLSLTPHACFRKSRFLGVRPAGSRWPHDYLSGVRSLSHVRRSQQFERTKDTLVAQGKSG